MTRHDTPRRTRHTPHQKSRRLLAPLLAAALATGAAACAERADESPLASDRAGDGTADNDAGGSDGGDTSDGDGDGGASNPDTIDWRDCMAGVECAEVEVPVDYDDPEGDTLTLSVSRVPASGERIGSLFVNPGGPGATAADLPPTIAAIAPAEITESFDIVGVDPRGLGASDFDCGMDGQEIYGVDYSIDSPQDEQALLDLSEEYIDGCEAEAGDLLPHLGTENVARDIDAVREMMGDEELNYLGYSYGTAIGQMLAELFPERLRAMILDGVLDLGPTGVELAEAQAAGFESALAAFEEDCDDSSSCPIAPDAHGAIEELIDRVEQEPIPASPRDLGPGELGVAMAYPLYSESLWPQFQVAIADALEGDGSGMVQLADQYLDGDWDIYFAVNCLDFAWPETPEELLADGAASEDESPIFGEWIVNDYVRCSMWPTEADPLEPVTAPGTPPIMVVSTTNDPATPYEAGVRTAERLEEGVLLSYEGEGHTIVFNGEPCVDDAATSYLVDLEPPEDGATC